jgi:hypothetical protein
MHSDDGGNQQFIAPSFLALYLAPGNTRPRASRQVMGERYEVCEDLATALVDLADNQRWSLGVTEDAVLERVWRGLADGQAGVDEPEARWVLRRLAELLNWPAWSPPEPGPTGQPGAT